jgi:hypothetical protein
VTFADRALDSKLAWMSTQAFRALPGTDMKNQVLSLSIDGMDQAKWRVPRVLAAAKDLSNTWRPVTPAKVSCYCRASLMQIRES